MSKEVRDRVAKLDGWKFTDGTEPGSDWEMWSHPDGRACFVGSRFGVEPFADDMNAVFAAWDKHAQDWWDTRRPYEGTWVAFNRESKSVCVDITGHDSASKCRDMWKLLGLVLDARGV